MASEEARTERARTIYERWQEYLGAARAALPSDADLDRILYRAIAQWREHEPPELAFVPEELTAERRETRHETTEDRFIERVERGEVVALRRLSDGEVHYLEPADYDRMDEAERAAFAAYDPLLARAIRRHVTDEALPPDTASQ
jgi:hypothetical protein